MVIGWDDSPDQEIESEQHDLIERTTHGTKFHYLIQDHFLDEVCVSDITWERE